MRFLVSSGVDRRAMIRPDDPHYHTITLDVLFHLLGNFDNVIHVYGQQGHNGYIGELEGHTETVEFIKIDEKNRFIYALGSNNGNIYIVQLITSSRTNIFVEQLFEIKPSSFGFTELIGNWFSGKADYESIRSIK